MTKRAIYIPRDDEIYSRYCAGEKRKKIAADYGITESGVKQVLARVRKVRGIKKVIGVRA